MTTHDSIHPEKTLLEYLVKNITPHKIIDIPVTISTDESYKKEEP